MARIDPGAGCTYCGAEGSIEEDEQMLGVRPQLYRCKECGRVTTADKVVFLDEDEGDADER